MFPGQHCRGSLTSGRYLLAPLIGNKKGTIPLWFSELSLYYLGSRPIVLYPNGQHNLPFFISCVPPVGLVQ